MAKTTRILCETAEGYFAALLDNGGVRVGSRGNECFDFPLDHPEFNRCTNLTIHNVESAYDEFFGAYCCA